MDDRSAWSRCLRHACTWLAAGGKVWHCDAAARREFGCPILQDKRPSDEDELPSFDDVPLDAMDAAEFQRRVEALAAQNAQRPAGSEDANPALTAVQEVSSFWRITAMSSRSSQRVPASVRRRWRLCRCSGG